MKGQKCGDTTEKLWTPGVEREPVFPSVPHPDLVTSAGRREEGNGKGKETVGKREGERR